MAAAPVIGATFGHYQLRSKLGGGGMGLVYLAEAPADVENKFRAAEVYEQLGQRAEALAWLREAVRAGYAVGEVKGDPTLEQLRSDPRYSAIVSDAVRNTKKK